MLWKGFQRPKVLEFERDTLTERFGRFHAQPFERGFGTTIGNALRRTGAGVHVKTAGTTWLEELIGLAEAGGDGLVLAQEIYAKALENVDALCEPYASVIDIDSVKLPTAEEVESWSGEDYANCL